MPAAPGAMRKLQLRTDASLPGAFLLRLSGDADAFRVWQSEHPATNETPLLVSQPVSPQSVTNGVNDISWNTTSTATLYIEAISSGAATLTYTFVGAGSAEGISRRASLQMTAHDIGVELWARDPETNDVYECTSLVLASHPVPQVELEVSGAEIDSNGALQVSFAGTFLDRMSEVVPAGQRVASIALDYRGDIFDEINPSYATADNSMNALWQPLDSATPFSSSIAIDGIAPGMHIFNAVTDENAAGETGRAYAYVFIGEEEDPPQPVTLDYPFEIAFTNAPTTNMLDAAFVQFDAGYAMTEISNSVPDIRWEGAASDGSSLVFAALAPLSAFSASGVDCFTATVRRVTFAGAIEEFAAIMQETSATSLVFTATSCFELEIASHPVILSTGTIEGTPIGFIEPFIAKIVSPLLSDTAITNLLTAKGWTLNVNGEPMRIVAVAGFGLCLADAASASDAPRIFTALADRAGTVPTEAWNERCMTFEFAPANGTILFECDSWITGLFSESYSRKTFSFAAFAPLAVKSHFYAQ
jgi:hypothetical protein